MKANLKTVLVGSRVVLVPYRVEHVPKYHDWMLSEELRTLTASEPLSLEEEYEMQQKWQLDEDKLTFIILARQPGDFLEPFTSIDLRKLSDLTPTDERLIPLPMVGDVNIFLNSPLEKLQHECTQTSLASARETLDDHEDDHHAEVEIMIAEPSFRRKGLAIEALQLMLGYATGQPDTFLDPSRSSSSMPSSDAADSSTPKGAPVAAPYEASDSLNESSTPNISPSRLLTRISETNDASIQLFQKLGFRITKRVEVFGEVEMRYLKWSAP